MAHDVDDVSVAAGCIGNLPAKEDGGVRIHHGLIGRHGLVQLPEDDGLWVIHQVLTDTGQVLENLDAQIG